MERHTPKDLLDYALLLTRKLSPPPEDPESGKGAGRTSGTVVVLIRVRSAVDEMGVRILRQYSEAWWCFQPMNDARVFACCKIRFFLVLLFLCDYILLYEYCCRLHIECSTAACAGTADAGADDDSAILHAAGQ